MSENPDARTMRAMSRLMKIERERAFRTALATHLATVRKMKAESQIDPEQTEKED